MTNTKKYDILGVENKGDNKMKRGRKKKRGRPRKKKMSSRQKMKWAKGVTGEGKHRKFVYLTCKLCKKEWSIHTNDKSVYTDEVRKKWICIFCK